MIIVLTYLVLLGIRDYRNRQVPICWLIIGALFLIAVGIYRCIQGNLSWIDMLTGMIPGALLLLIAWLSGKAGYADGIVLMELGLCLGYRESFVLLCLALLLLSVVSIILLVLRKVCKNTKMPFLSFLALVFLLRQL